MKKGDRFILIRINSNKAFAKNNSSILDEQYQLFQNHGFVWFLKKSNYLKSINLELMNNKLNKCHSIVIRDSKINNSISYYCNFWYYLFANIFRALTRVDLLIPVIDITSRYECNERRKTAFFNSISVYFLGRPSL